MQSSALAYLQASRCRFDEAMAGLLTEGEPVALLDFPDHGNVGDSAIWMGELAYLQRTGTPIAYAAAVRGRFGFDERDFERAFPSGTVLLHGGGNFGDLWPRHQRFREQLLRRYRTSHSFVVFPQTIWYSDLRAQERSLETMASVESLTVLSRDMRGIALLEGSGVTCRLCPDAAVNLEPLAAAAPAKQQQLWLLRGDHEAQRSLAAPDEPVAITDWTNPEEVGSHTRPRAHWQARRLMRATARRLLHGSNAPTRRLMPGFGEQLKTRAMNSIATERLDAGLQQLTEHEVVVTDRLHAALLSTIAGRPFVAIDSGYGKLSGYFNDHGVPKEGVLIEHESEAFETAARMASGQTT